MEISLDKLSFLFFSSFNFDFNFIMVDSNSVILILSLSGLPGVSFEDNYNIINKNFYYRIIK